MVGNRKNMSSANSYWESFFQYNVARLKREKTYFDKFILQDAVVMLNRVSEMMMQREEQLIHAVVERVRANPDINPADLCKDFVVSPKERLFDTFLQKDGKVMLNTRQVSDQELKQIMTEPESEAFQKYIDYFKLRPAAESKALKIKAVVKAPKPKPKRQAKKEAQNAVKEFGVEEEIKVPINLPSPPPEPERCVTPSKRYTEKVPQCIQVGRKTFMFLDGIYYDDRIQEVTDPIIVEQLEKYRQNQISSQRSAAPASSSPPPE